MASPDLSDRQSLTAALVASVAVGVEVILATRRLTMYNCPRSVPESASEITEAGIDHLHVDWAGCAIIVPLAPTYLGLVALLALAVWVQR